MNDPMLEPAVVSSEDIITITRDVWLSFLDLELEAVPLEAALLSVPAMAAAVQISGAWEGTVRLECGQGHAEAVAARMFSEEAGEVSAEQARDALGELANVVTGNIKSLLPAPSALSMPVCWSTSAHQSEVESAAALVSRTALAGPSGVLHVSIWKAVVS
jgi:chemotaxis protein CheX